MNTNEFDVFSVCNIAYLPKTLVLADTLYAQHHKKLIVVLFDRKQELSFPIENIRLIWIEDLGLAAWRQLAFLYDIIEFSTSLKPFIALTLLKSSKKVIFLDPDTAIYSPLDPVLEDLEEHAVVLTPHYTRPQPDTSNESDLAMMRFGSFNLGFFAVNRTKQAIEFLEWWSRRCIDFSYMESQFGLSTDQKWVSIAPCLFEDIKISFNPGYNAAPWNTFERNIGIVGEGRYVVNKKYPLVFFHFSNFDHNDVAYMQKRASCETGKEYEALEVLGNEYSMRLKQKESSVPKIPYSFDYMSDGSYISPTLRRAYASVRERIYGEHDPFDRDGVVGAFAQKNGLLSKVNAVRYRYPGLRDAKENSRYFDVVYFVFRLLLRFMGPNRFYDLSKLMVYLSIYRAKTHKYWRL